MQGLLPDRIIFFLLYSFLTLGIFLTIKQIKTWQDIQTKNKRKCLLLGLFPYHILNFYIIFELVTLPPSNSGGHGNPFIPYIAVSIVIFLTFCIVVFIESYKALQPKSSSIKVFTMALSLAALILSIYFQLDYMNEVKDRLARPIGNWLESWKDPRLSGVYFNLFTFILLTSLSVLFGTVSNFVRKGKK